MRQGSFVRVPVSLIVLQAPFDAQNSGWPDAAHTQSSAAPGYRESPLPDEMLVGRQRDRTTGLDPDCFN
jgi:hypothetical protein